MQGAQRDEFQRTVARTDVTLALGFACKEQFFQELLRALHFYVLDLIKKKKKTLILYTINLQWILNENWNLLIKISFQRLNSVLCRGTLSCSYVIVSCWKSLHRLFLSMVEVSKMQHLDLGSSSHFVFYLVSGLAGWHGKHLNRCIQSFPQVVCEVLAETLNFSPKDLSWDHSIIIFASLDSCYAESWTVVPVFGLWRGFSSINSVWLHLFS